MGSIPSKSRKPSPRQQLDAALAADRKQRGGAPRANWTADSRGRMHPSGEEARWFDGLYAREALGEIKIIAFEPKWEILLGGKHLCWVKADAEIAELRTAAPSRRFIDYKGRSGDTEVSRLKHKMVRMQHGVEIELVGPYIERKRAAAQKRRDERALLKRAKGKPRN